MLREIYLCGYCVKVTSHRQAAEAAAAKQFNISQEQRTRLIVQERDFATRQPLTDSAQYESAPTRRSQRRAERSTGASGQITAASSRSTHR